MPAPSLSPQPVSGKKGRPSGERPIDLVHLSRQTLGDHALELEVLGLMERQILAFSGRLGLATMQERRQIAHALKGAARNVGAFALAGAAETVEQAPDDVDGLIALCQAMDSTAAFIARMRN